ncbi:MAG: EFR1 family ferrodoxin [Candidatus Pacearchaeota archaeon]|jgi:flavodoxin
MTITKKQFNPGKGVIYYFSGTGNTAFVASEFQANYKKAKIDVDIFPIETIETVPSQSKYTFIMIGFPTYAFYPPQMVIDFVKKLPEVNDKPVILFGTAGGSAGASFSILENILKKKHYTVVSNFLYVMPDNVYFMFGKDTQSNEQTELLITNTTEKVKMDFEIIISGKSKFVKCGFFLKLMSEIVHFFFNNLGQKQQKNRWYWDRKECTFCGLCEKSCPTKNITMKKEKGKITWGNNCMFCTRCYNFCPRNAIHYKSINKTNKFNRYTRLKDEIL